MLLDPNLDRDFAVSANALVPDRARALLDFWFGPPDDPGRLHHRQIWFRSTPEFDEAVRRGFAADHDRAVAGALGDWEARAESALALVMLLDQVPRNIFRSTSRAFASDAQALAATNRALARGYDREVPAGWRLFFYLPFEHSEVLADQQRGIALLEALPPVAGRPSESRMSRRHLEIIERFGRFPHRNPILGRDSTAAELAFLDECDLRFGQPYRGSSSLPPEPQQAGGRGHGPALNDQ
jgi:uncharacterized protein (DUF924 family)